MKCRICGSKTLVLFTSIECSNTDCGSHVEFEVYDYSKDAIVPILLTISTKGVVDIEGLRKHDRWWIGINNPNGAGETHFTGVGMPKSNIVITNTENLVLRVRNFSKMDHHFVPIEINIQCNDKRLIPRVLDCV